MSGITPLFLPLGRRSWGRATDDVNIEDKSKAAKVRIMDKN